MKRQLEILVICLLLVGCHSTPSSKSQAIAAFPSLAEIRAGLPSTWRAHQDGKQIVISSLYNVYFYNSISMDPETLQPGGLLKYVKKNAIQKPYRIILTAGIKLEDSEFAKRQADNAESAEQLQKLKAGILPIYRKYDGKFMFSTQEPHKRRAPYFFKDFEPSEHIKATRYEEMKRSFVLHKLPLFYSADHSVYVVDNNLFGLNLYPEKVDDDRREVMELLKYVFAPYQKDIQD